MQRDGQRQQASVSRQRLRSLWKNLTNAFWFIPLLISAASVGLFALTWYGSRALEGGSSEVPVIFESGPTAARALLAAVMTGLITIAGTIFSVTIVVLQLASSQYSPRLLPRNFIGDRGAQTVLGIYLGMTIYSIVGLMALGNRNSAEFSTLIAAGGVVWMGACIAGLVYFVAHVSTLIQSSSAVQSAQDQAQERISSLRDLEVEDRREFGPTILGDYLGRDGVLDGEPAVVRARDSGYIQVLNVEALAIAVAESVALLEPVGGSQKMAAVEVPYSPGSFIPGGEAMVKIWPSRGVDPESGVENTVRKALAIGRERSFNQDFAFGFRQLSDVIMKTVANDPATAMQALDRMEALFITLGQKEMPARIQEREAGSVRVVVGVGYYGFDEVVGVAFDQARRAALASGQVAVLDRLLEVIGRAIEENHSPGRQEALWERAMDVARQAPSQLPDSHDAVNLMQHAVRVAGPLMDTELAPRVREDLESMLHLSEGLPGSESLHEAVREARGCS